MLELLAAGHKVWRFEGGEPYMPTPQPIKDAMAAALARNETRYAPSSGVPELRRAIVEKVRGKNGIPRTTTARSSSTAGCTGSSRPSRRCSIRATKS